MRGFVLMILVSGCGATSPGGTDAPLGDARATIDAPSAPVDAAGTMDAHGAGADAAVARVACGAMSCPATPTISMNVDTEDYCCAPSAGGGAAFCVHGNLGACESGNPFYCDQAADCNSGLVCCNSSVRPGLFHCDVTCGDLQMCGSSTECRNGNSCTFRTCGGAQYGFCGALTSPQATALGCI